MVSSHGLPVSESEFERIREEALEFAGLGFFSFRFDGTVLAMDRGAWRILELEEHYPDPSAAIGRPIAELMTYITPEGTLRRAIREHARVRGLEWAFVSLKGNPRCVLQDSYLLSDPEGGAEEIRVVIHDVTEQRLAEERLRRRDAILDTLHFATRGFLTTDNWEASIQSVLARLGQAARVGRVTIYEAVSDEGGRRLFNVNYEWYAPSIETPGLTEREAAERHARELAHADPDLSAGRPYQATTPECPADARASLEEQGIRSVLALPIFIGPVYWGVIRFDAHDAAIRWADLEVEAMKSAAEVFSAAIQRRRIEREREGLIDVLQQALAEVRSLSGLLPICSSCRKIRNDKGYWEQLETYIRARSDLDFSHSLCPDCAQSLYPDYAGDED